MCANDIHGTIYKEKLIFQISSPLVYYYRESKLKLFLVVSYIPRILYQHAEKQI